MPTRLILGLMSGTSVDAIDAALVRIHGPASAIKKVQTLHHIEHPWPPKLRQRLLAIMAPANTTTQEICALNVLVAHEFAAAAQAILRAAHLDKSKITAIGSHGQTVCHLPPPAPSKKFRKYAQLQNWMKRHTHHTPSTLQLGDPSVIATLTGITTVGNFRPADMAVRGQGAPLVPFTDDILLTHPNKTRCIQNIGGIANVTYLPSLSSISQNWTFYTPWSASKEIPQIRPRVLAFDTGPGNMLLDAVVNLATNARRRFDRNGALANRGAVSPALFNALRRHPYFSRKPPKSTGREDFGLTLATRLYQENIVTKKISLEDLLATLTHLTAWSIADAYARHLPQLPDEVILCGGGADNPVLIRMLTAQLLTQFPSAVPRLRRIDDFGIPNKAKEAVSFALLALATLDGIPGNLPTVTGAIRPVILGTISRPL